MGEKNKGTRKVHFDSTYQQYPSVPDAAPESNPQEVAGKLEHGVASQYQKFKARSPVEWVESVFPIVEWLRMYDFKEYFLADIIAGLTVAAVVVPQGISYSMLAGMPVQFGLYCCLCLQRIWHKPTSSCGHFCAKQFNISICRYALSEPEW